METGTELRRLIHYIMYYDRARAVWRLSQKHYLEVPVRGGKDWERTPDSRQWKSLLGCYYLKRFQRMLTRKLVRILKELLTRHCRLRTHLSKLEIENWRPKHGVLTYSAL